MLIKASRGWTGNRKIVSVAGCCTNHGDRLDLIRDGLPPLWPGVQVHGNGNVRCTLEISVGPRMHR